MAGGCKRLAPSNKCTAHTRKIAACHSAGCLGGRGCQRIGFLSEGAPHFGSGTYDHPRLYMLVHPFTTRSPIQPCGSPACSRIHPPIHPPMCFPACLCVRSAIPPLHPPTQIKTADADAVVSTTKSADGQALHGVGVIPGSSRRLFETGVAAKWIRHVQIDATFLTAALTLGILHLGACVCLHACMFIALGLLMISIRVLRF